MQSNILRVNKNIIKLIAGGLTDDKEREVYVMTSNINWFGSPRFFDGGSAYTSKWVFGVFVGKDIIQLCYKNEENAKEDLQKLIGILETFNIN